MVGYWKDKGTLRAWRWILIAFALLVGLAFLTFTTSLVFPNSYGYVDFAAGRRRSWPAAR